MFPKTNTVHNGIDYYSSQPVLLPRGCHVSGVGSAEGDRATTIQFAAGQAGLVCPSACVIEHLFLNGGNPYRSGTVATIPNADGIQAGSGTKIYDVLIESFGRHGVMAASDLASGFIGWPTQFDSVITEGVTVYSCLGDGFHFSGNDGAAGVEIRPQAYSNQGTAFSDTSLYGNIWNYPLSTGNGVGFNAGGHAGQPTFNRPYSESDTSVGQFCSGSLCAAVYDPTGVSIGGLLAANGGVVEQNYYSYKEFLEGLLVLPENYIGSGDGLVTKAWLGYDPDYYGLSPFVAQNVNPTDPINTVYSQVIFRRNFYGSGNNASGNASNWWCWMLPGTYSGTLPTSSSCYADNLTDPLRSAIKGNGLTWFPNGFLLGDAGSYTPTTFVGLGTAAPVAGNWKVSDTIINSNPTAGSPWGWRNVLAGTPGTWETLTFGGGPASVLFANLPASANGTMFYCSDCKNVADDTTGTFDSPAAGGGHGTNVLRENGAWRVH